MKRILLFSLIVLSFGSIYQNRIWAQSLYSIDQVGVPTPGSLGVNRSTVDIMGKEREQSALQITRMPRLPFEHEVERFDLNQNPESPEIDRFPFDAKDEKNRTELSGVMSPQTVGVTFLGATYSDAYAFPPDVMGDVGPSQYIVAINGRIRTFNKYSGTADGILNADMDVFFSTVLSSNSGTYTSDPRIRYDRLTGRWFVIIIDVPAGTGAIANRLLVAVSSGGTITSGTTWTYFYFIPNSSQFADYPTLGIDKNALYIGFNMFTLAGSYAGTMGYVVRKSSILSSGPIIATSLGILASKSGAGPYTPQGVDNFDTTATEGYFIGGDNVSYGLLQIRRVTNPGGTPSVSSNLSITVPTTSAPLTVPHLGNTGGTSGNLDALDDRLFAAVIRNGRLWTAHNISVNSSGTTTSADRDGVRWYEIGNLSTTPTLIQSGTVYDNSGSVRSYWIPSVNISGQGHVAMGFSVAGASDYVNAGTCGRYSSGTLGSMQSPALYTASTTAYNPSGDAGDATYGRRWGDYSYTSVDPNDNMTMWTIQEYCSSTNIWGVRVAKLIAPPPAMPVSALPSTVYTNTSNVTVAVTGTSSSGSAFYDPGAAFPNRLKAFVSGTGVTVNSVTFVDSLHCTLNLTIASGATLGARSITIMNPDSQSVASTSGIITIGNLNCGTITLSPATLPSGAAGTAFSQTITASGGTLPDTFAVSTGTLPQGLTLSSAGNLSGTPSYGGSYSFTITATDSEGCTGSQAYTLTVAGCPLITISPTSLPTGTLNVAYNQTISASGGTAAYTYAVYAGTPPTGLSLSSSGVLSGTPSVFGTFNFTVTATDANTCTANQAYSVVISCPTIALTPTTLSNGTLNVAYSQSLTASGGSSPYTYLITSGGLPTGLNLSTTGVLSGSPTVAVTSSFTVTATDVGSCTGSHGYSLTINAPANTPISLTALGTAYTQNFNSLVSTGTGDSTKLPLGWLFRETGGNSQYTAGTGSSNTGDTYSFGASSDSDRAFGGLQSNSLDPTIGAIFINNTGSVITSLVVQYTGEEWRLGATGRYDTLRFELSTDATGLSTGNWTNYTALTFLSPTITGTTGAVNGNSTTYRTVKRDTIKSLNISNGSTFYFRWIDGAISGSDDGLAVDDFSLIPLGSTVSSNPTIAGSASPSSVVAGNPIWLTATVTPGTNPASTGITVSGDLSAIGGSSAQQFYDDATHGDITAGDNIFSLTTTVDLGTSLGQKGVVVTATDAQMRSGSSLISILVTTAPTNPSIFGNAVPSSVVVGDSTLLTATVTAGTNPVSTGLVVEGDLSNIGGSATQLFYDNGSHGDVTPGDNIFSYYATVAGGTTAGMKPLAITVTDEQLRTDYDTISIVVTTIACPTITLSPSALPDDTLGTSYNQSISSTGGVAPYSYSISSGYLPDGITLLSTGTLSGVSTKAGTFYFTVIVYDSNYCAGSQSYSVQIFDSAMIVTTEYQEQWNLVSLPVSVINTAASTVFPDAISDAFGFTASGYQSMDQLEYGRGYWIKFGTTHNNNFVGRPLLQDTLDVMAGWNLIGSLSSTIPATAITPIGTTIQSSVFGYNGGYAIVDSLAPGKGYWIKVGSDGQLSMAQTHIMMRQYSDYTGTRDYLSSLNRLEFADASGATSTLYFGGDETQIPDLYSLPPVPPTGSFDARFSSQRFVETYSPEFDTPLQFPIDIKSANTAVTIRWFMVQNQGHSIVLQSLNTGNSTKEIELKGEGSIVNPIGDQTRLVLKIDRQENYPTSFMLHPNHPNPFNPTTLIGYDLPAPSYVVLTVYNLLGQEVTRLVDGIESAGEKSVEWNAHDVPTGIYFYKINAVQVDGSRKTFSQVRKMVYMK
jgi:hypothetical protein